MKFVQWLHNKKAEKMPENVVAEKTIFTEHSVLSEKMCEIEKKSIEEKKFIDEATGKSYKTERGLKGAITRRLNKAKKAKERENE